ncbi:hypothetical protein T440DRAFT_443563 [Plenodomus tracheiphilus IPT5]|uniref:Ribosomal protein s17 n=1 Tax=Plenodomus tracheiphilus IPT5 TaxID=1408161 RepID=A0A6A7BH31_9PLEO|nr:hypothetical protein T440DRAFT_443563 [Plenodomus tracheiphilus IPT5]
MRYATVFSLLLAAGVANAQFGGQGGFGQGGQGQGGQGGQGQGGQGQGGQGQGGQGGQNGQGNNNNNNNGGNNNNNNANALALDPNNVQKASQVDGFDGGEEAGQAKSATDQANFINFCTGKTLTNGLQTKTGSCNGIVMGDIPASNKMISAVFTNPKNGDKIAPDTPITFSVKIDNLVAGTFTNPDNTYYAAPQALEGGLVVGHTHVSVQDLGGQENPTEPLDAETFAFFKGINDAGDGQGTLSADLAAGLPVGLYRVCSITSAANHQPVVMPVAQRGPQDDCVRFEVTNQGGGGNGGQNNGQNNGGQNNGQNGQNNGGQNNGQGGQQGQQGQQGQGAQGQQGGQGAQGQQGGQGAGAQGQQAQQGQGQGQGGFGRGRGRGRFNRPKFAARDFIA